jgi:hypothetical protein
MQPKPESRISNLENRTTTIEAILLEMSSDQAEELKVIRQELKDGFLQIGTLFDRNFESIEALQQDVATVKATMATKDDIAELKSMMKQLLQQKSGE